MPNRRFVPTVATMLLFLSATAGAADKPNIVLINADDLGYGDVGCYGATKIQTPHIDRLAAEGRRFTDAHTASAVCSPSRYGLMTGRYPLRKNFWGPLPFTNKLTIDTSRPTIASVLKSAGYETAIIGKWHLGFGKDKADWNKPLKPGPLELGFDYYFGMPTVNSGPPFVYVENHSVVDYDPADPFVMKTESVTQKFPEKGGYKAIGGAKKAHERYRDEYVGTTLAEKAVDWIKQRKASEPFFLYLATTNIHHPFTPHPKFKGTSQCGLYGDFVHELDWIVGEVLRTLDEQGLAENTLVVFTSDNGGMLNNTGQEAWQAGHRQNGILLGHKFGAWEGGHRVPFIVRWPGKVPAGTASDALVSQIDLLPTFGAIADGVIPTDAEIDGVNQLDEFKGKAENPARELLVISPNSPKHLLIRKGNWVFIPAQDEGGFQGKNIGDHLLGGAASQKLTGLVNSDITDGRIRVDAPPTQLYDLGTDPRQAENVSTKYPDVVAELTAELTTYRREIPSSDRLGWINLSQSTGGKQSGKGVAAKIPAGQSKRSASLDFESGELLPWKVVDGDFGHLIGNRQHFINNRQEYNKQGEFYLTTLEASPDAKKGKDSQMGVVVSPLFIPKKGTMTFRVGGGNGTKTYVALCTADGKEILHARGANKQQMQNHEWKLGPYAGQKVFIKIVDQAPGGWGHITADDFQFDGKILTEYPE
ncbi:MAG: arylsulfatase [Planctomycetota bacterium]